MSRIWALDRTAGSLVSSEKHQIVEGEVENPKSFTDKISGELKKAGCEFCEDSDLAQGILGSREKKTSVLFTGKNTIRVSTRLSDPYHEVELRAEFSYPDLIILEIEPCIKRFPHSACWKGAETIRCMKGEKAGPGIMKKLIQKVGRKGCYHVNALFRETVECAIWGRGRRIRFMLKELYPEVFDLQIYRLGFRFRPELLDSCYAYLSQGDLVKAIKNTPLPEEIDFQTIEELNKAYQALKGDLSRRQ